MRTVRSPRSAADQILFTRADLKPGRTLLFRIALVLALFALVFLVLWLERDGLKDNQDDHMTAVDVLYFAMVTVTTVGYGDIVPVTPRARLLDAVFVTPIRLVIWFLFLGTAYQLVVRQYMEGYRMAKVQAALRDHIIVCGFGYTGWSAAKELLAKGAEPDRIAVIDRGEERVRAALELGLIAFRGDATQEAMLQHAMIQRARAVIIATGRDDANALVLLTARHLNPTVEILVSAVEEENVKLFRQGGASAIISPSTFGGYLLAAAVGHPHFTEYVQDLLTAGGRVNLIERPVEPEEIGRTASALKPDILLRLYRRGSVIHFWDLQEGEKMETGDILLVLKSTPDATASDRAA
ncbi:potassium channel family protein [Nitrospira moscoviensis]|uniref:Putative potassium channel NAD-binding component TrkA n=1 Tax=Nitrospira moscoviensis TaxID=42253 RepID=A0A0K2GBE4_NITMO|nr:potassium channel protein [Nitrospira moscoviensis]ALA58291.1 putative potassium channel NAD-binding component TrkA [Nitrospira moscoviensis]